MDDRGSRYADAAIAAELDELARTSSGRNAALNRAAFVLGGFVAADVLSEDVARQRLEQACEANGYARKDGIRDVRTTIKSGLRKGMQTPRSLPRDVSVDNDQARTQARQTLESFARKRKVPLDALKHMGWEDTPRGIAIRYTQRDGSPARTQFRGPTWSSDRFAWDSIQKDLPIIAYDPDQGALAREHGYLLICEGASDAATASYAGLPVVGIPGDQMLRKTLQAHHLEGVSRVYVCVDVNAVGDPDSGGERFRGDVPRHLATVGYTGSVHELRMPGGAKDMSELWTRDPEQFVPAMQAAMRDAQAGPKPRYRTLAEAARALRPIAQRLTTGFPSLDRAMRGGIPLGSLVMVNGAPGAGKTALGVCQADRWERQGCAVVYYAGDQRADGITVRFAQLAGHSRDAIESTGEIGARIRADFAAASEGRALVVYDPYDPDSEGPYLEDAAKALAHLAVDRPQVMIVDSLQMARSGAAEEAETSRARIDAVVASLVRLSRQGVTVVALSEVSRVAYRTGSRQLDATGLSSGKESSSIEYQGDALLVLRSIKDEPDMIDVEVAKNSRFGDGTPDLRLRLDRARHTFEEVERPSDGDGVTDTHAARAEADARALIRVLLEHPGVGERALRDQARAVLGWGTERIGAAKARLERGVDGYRAINRGTERASKWFAEGGHDEA